MRTTQSETAVRLRLALQTVSGSSGKTLNRTLPLQAPLSEESWQTVPAKAPFLLARERNAPISPNSFLMKLSTCRLSRIQHRCINMALASRTLCTPKAFIASKKPVVARTNLSVRCQATTDNSVRRDVLLAGQLLISRKRSAHKDANCAAHCLLRCICGCQTLETAEYDMSLLRQAADVQRLSVTCTAAFVATGAAAAAASLLPSGSAEAAVSSLSWNSHVRNLS